MRRMSTRAAGLLILILGIWGGLVPFIGPYFHFSLGPTKSWTWTTGRFWLDVLPAIVAIIGGLMLLGSGPRPGGKLGALLALAAGTWFAIGPQVSLLWNASGAQGAAHGAKFIRVLELLTYHTLLGVIIAALAGYALPGLVTRRTAAAEEAAAEESAVAAAPAAAPRTADDEYGYARRHAVDRSDGLVAEHVDEPVAPTRRVDTPDRAYDGHGVGADRREPVGAGEPVGAVPEDRVDRPAEAPASDPGEGRMAVIDRPAAATDASEAESARAESARAESAPTESAPAESARAESVPAESVPARDPAPADAPAPMTMRRRRGGLFSRFRS